MAEGRNKVSIVLTVYSARAFKTYLLPAVDNTNEEIVLSKNLFNIPQNYILYMEVINRVWSFLPTSDYSLVCADKLYFGCPIADGDIVRLQSAEGNQISIVVNDTDRLFSVYSKYVLSPELGRITIGKNDDCVIHYDNLGLISRQHAEIVRHEGRYLLNDVSTNGVFVNSIRINGNIVLSFGDTIDIYGLRIVFLGSMIAVNTEDPAVKVDSSVMHEYRQSSDADKSKPAQGIRGRLLFHRSPRHITRFDVEPIEIDAPPNPRELDQPNMLTTIGPAMTMALPMVLGCGLSIAASQRQGGMSSAFMYTGLVTAVSSAVLGTIWAIVGMKNAKKKFIEDEKKREVLYGKYLQKCDAEVKEKYDHNTQILRERYYQADECLKYDEHNPNLWNRNSTQEDFLSERIGIGLSPFQADIVIPKERFTMISDELAAMPKKIKNKYSMLREVPVCLNLAENKLFGIIGGEKKKGAYSVIYDLVSQIAANNCYTDVKLAFIFDEKDIAPGEYIGFTRWLPHVWNETRNFRYVSQNKEEASEVFYEITKVLRQRAENAKEAGGDQSQKDMLPKPYYILIISDPEMLEGQLISKYIFDNKDEYGLTTILLVERYEDLPNSCEKIIENDENFSGTYSVYDTAEERIPVNFDVVSSLRLETFARDISDIEVSEMETGGDIPTSLTFFDMYGIRHLNELNVLDRWRKNRTYESMKALVGQRAGGTACYLDIHEKYHGPHGLVAGTTGSGKSETLQTYILSLAINYSPDDVGFFVIDYKGGGMANLFTGLPHLIGQISNLSGNQVRRAMVSIKSENVRRQRIFNEYGVNNINSYTKLYKNNEAKDPVPHLFIIIDEFAELKREEPDFMRELISVAQVGRSLGVHLILATQKPSGTVDDNIWSNSKFRLCLRVQDRQDSIDMLHRPDAAYITQAGRCYLQVGNDELFELFQSGYSGATYSEDEEEMRTDLAKMISINGRAALEGNRAKHKRKEQVLRSWITSFVSIVRQAREEVPVSGTEDIAYDSEIVMRTFSKIAQSGIDYQYGEYNAKRIAELIRLYDSISVSFDGTDEELAVKIIDKSREEHRKLPEMKEKSQLDAVVEYLGEVAAQNGYDHNLQLWLPVLPTCIYLKDIAGFTDNMYDGTKWPEHAGAWSLAVEAGFFDDPVNQNQAPYVIDMAKSGNLAVCGMGSTGKSTFLATYIYALITHYTPDDINIYALDFSSKMLGSFEGAPHVGGVMFENDEEKIDKFFTMLGQIFEQRKVLFKGGNYSQYIRAKGKKLPVVFIVIDNMSAFRSKTANKYDDFILRISKEGVGYGVYLAIASNGFGTAETPGRIADNLHNVVCFEMNDKFQYAEVMRNIHLEVLPEVNVKGRGLVFAEGTILEFQAGLTIEAEDDFKRAEKIGALCKNMAVSWKGKHAKPIPFIPEKPLWSEYSQMDDVKDMIADDRTLPVGYDAKFASPFGLDLSDFYTYIISGTAHTGKTNMLKVLMLAAREKGGRVVLFDFNSELEGFAKSIGVEIVKDGKQMYDFYAKLKPEFIERNKYKKQLVEQGVETENLYKAMDKFENQYFFIADLPSFITRLYKPGEGVPVFSPLAENLFDKGEYHRVYWFACLNQDLVADIVGMTAYEVFKRYKAGIHFGGDVSGRSQRIFSFDYLSYTDQAKQMKPGIGLLPSSGTELKTTKVVIPMAK